MIAGDDVPPICSKCRNSYWEEMTYGEDAYCGKYDMICERALRNCELISLKDGDNL